jgi:kynureninase
MPGDATRADALALDRDDRLAEHRDRFALPDDVIYLDGNSLGALPRATAPRLAAVVAREWGDGLIRSWNSADWVNAPRRIGAKIAPLIGAASNEVICADSTSINLFKVLAAALCLTRKHSADARAVAGSVLGARHARRVILSERDNFPTDLYMIQGLVELLRNEFELCRVEASDLPGAIDATVAVVVLTHVNYQSGAMHDLAALTAQAHAAGALVIWDLAHSAGAVPLDLRGAGADFAIGCGYKYLNGGPGAPAFVYVAERHQRALAQEPFAQPLAGWFGHRAPFEFGADYAPAAGIDRFAVGTPSIIALGALEEGVATVAAAGIEGLRAKSMQLTELFIALVATRCAGLDLRLISPRAAAQRGSQVAYAHPHAWPVMQALINHAPRSVIGDFRAPDILRFGVAPLYVRFADVWDAVDALREILVTQAWQRPEWQTRPAVT